MKITQRSDQRAIALAAAFVFMAASGGSALGQTAAGAGQSASDSAGSVTSAASSSAAAAASATSSSATSSSAAAPASPPDASQGAQNTPAIPGQVLYTLRKDPPHLVDSRLSYVELGLLGVSMMFQSGKDIVASNTINNPGNDIARKFAAYFADQNGVLVDANPLPVEPGKLKDVKAALGDQHGNARYVVDVEPAQMNLMYFSFDWGHDDLIFNDAVQVFDAQTGRVVLSAKCAIPSKKDPDNLKTRDELLANNAAELKVLIGKKADLCLAAMIEKAKPIIKVAGASQ